MLSCSFVLRHKWCKISMFPWASLLVGSVEIQCQRREPTKYKLNSRRNFKVSSLAIWERQDSSCSKWIAFPLNFGKHSEDTLRPNSWHHVTSLREKHKVSGLEGYWAFGSEEKNHYVSLHTQKAPNYFCKKSCSLVPQFLPSNEFVLTLLCNPSTLGWGRMRTLKNWYVTSGSLRMSEVCLEFIYKRICKVPFPYLQAR